MIEQYNLCFYNFNTGKDRIIIVDSIKYSRLGAIHPEMEVANYLHNKNYRVSITTGIGGRFGIKYGDFTEKEILDTLHIKNSSEVFCQGLPDLIIEYKNSLHFLEVKNGNEYLIQKNWIEKNKCRFNISVCRIWFETIKTVEEELQLKDYNETQAMHMAKDILNKEIVESVLKTKE